MRLITLFIVTVTVLVILVFAGRFYFSEDSFSTTNPFWDSIGQVSSMYKTYDLYSLPELAGAGNGSTLLIIGPTETYTAADSAYVLAFMQRGGKVVVMDDNGTANTLLDHINSPITINQQHLCQADDYYVRPSFPALKNFSDAQVLNKVSSLVLNQPVSLNLSDQATIVASTSLLGWLDANDNCIVDKGERFSAYPVIASASYDKGELLVIGDPDVLTNGMLDKGDNKAFIANIMADDTVYIDMTHGHGVPALARLLYVIKTDIVAQALCALLIVIAGYIYYQRKSLVRLLKRSRAGEEGYMDEKESMVSFMKSKFLLNEHEINELNKKL
jgi:hypothetical protein